MILLLQHLLEVKKIHCFINILPLLLLNAFYYMAVSHKYWELQNSQI